MGDRALVVFKHNGEFSPVVYLHWHGHKVAEWISELKQYMRGREGDLSYVAARFVGICHQHIDGNLSLGIMDGGAEMAANPKESSHGDHGFIIVDAATFEFEQHGHYPNCKLKTTA